MKKLILAITLLATLSGVGISQTTVALSPIALPQFFNNSGAICSGCKLSTFAAGTTTPLATFQDSAGSVPQSNPIVMDASGRPPATIFLQSAAYKFKMTDSNNVQLWVADNITWVTPLTGFAGIIDTSDFTLQQSTAATSGANQSSNNLKIQGNYWNGAASALDTWNCQDVLGTGANPTSTLTCTHSGSSGAATFSIPGTMTIGSAVKLTETSAPTCALGTDFIWGDSVAHRAKACDNNGTAAQLVHSGADINTTDQVTVTHLAAALPVLQGGTGVTTAQGNGTKVQLASGGTTTGNFLDYDANGNAIDSGKIAPSGTVVGTTDAQVLTSKILTGVNNGNTVTTPSGCPEQGPTGTLTGNAADQTIYTCTLAGNVLRAGTGIRITTYVNHTTGAGAITYKVNFGGTTYTTTSPTDTAVAAERYSVTLFNNAGVTNAQSGVAEVFSGGAYGIGSLSSSAIDTTAGAAITVTFNAANTQQVQGRIFFVELLQ